MYISTPRSPEAENLLPHRGAHSPTFQSIHLRHNSFSNPSVTLPTSQLILQPYCCFTYVIVHSPTLLLLLLHHKLFTWFTWQAVHVWNLVISHLKYDMFWISHWIKFEGSVLTPTLPNTIEKLPQKSTAQRRSISLWNNYTGADARGG